MRIDNPNISAVIITNDNPMVINAIDSVCESCTEIILVNTVKTDKVKELTRNYKKVRYFYFKWVDDFSKARNYGIRKATGDWILTIDSDEILTEKIHFLDDRFLAYHTKQINKGSGFPTARIFQNHKGIFYRNRVHETIDHALTPETSCNSDVIIEHSGYDVSEEEMQKKLKRNFDLMLKDKKNVIYNMHMGALKFAEKDFDKALTYYTKALKDRLNDSHLAVICNNIHACRFMLEQPLDVLILTLRRSLFYEPFQMYARVNIIEHLMSQLNDENKEMYIAIIENELRKIRDIWENKLSALLYNELIMTEDYLQEKYSELNKWKTHYEWEAC